MTPVDIYAAFVAPLLLIAGAYALMRMNRSSILAARRRETAANAADDATDYEKAHKPA